MEIYCPNCNERRPGATDGSCPECGESLVAEPSDTRSSTRPPPIPVSGAPADPKEKTPEEETPDDVGTLFREVGRSSAPPLRPPSTPPPSRSRFLEPATREPSPRETKEWESRDENRAVEEIREFVEQGYQPFGFVGFPASGKTHFLKALATLLGTHGLTSEKAADLDKELLPGVSKAQTHSYDFASHYGKWLFVDVGGELYASLTNNNWTLYSEEKLELTRWLERSRGLFLFLHPTRAHVDRREMHRAYPNRDRRDPGAAEKMAERARGAQNEILFLGQMLHFLRAVRAENGDIDAVIDRCRRADTLQEGLRIYNSSPKLDIPVMLFLTKADSYGPGFEIAEGVQFFPRRMATSPMAFAARYLPGLFGPLLQHTRRFKIDFLQSYVEFPLQDETGRPKMKDGMPVIDVQWEARPQIPLSVGLTQALEFILRHPPGKDVRPWWRDLISGHGLDTRRALLLHRRLEPRSWEHVKLDLGSWWDEG